VSGYTGQQSYAVAIGFSTGFTNQGSNAVAIGRDAGQTTQGINSVAIGTSAGLTNQGSNAIAIGNVAGQISQASNSIILNATGATLNNTIANTFTVKPIRNETTTSLTLTSPILFYEPTSGEIAYGTNAGVGQTWHSISTSSRVKNQIYSNTNPPYTGGRVMHINAAATNNYYIWHTFQVYVNNIKCGESKIYAATEYNAISFIVPPGSTYKWDTPDANTTLVYWYEYY